MARQDRHDGSLSSRNLPIALGILLSGISQIPTRMKPLITVPSRAGVFGRTISGSADRIRSLILCHREFTLEFASTIIPIADLSDTLISAPIESTNWISPPFETMLNASRELRFPSKLSTNILSFLPSTRRSFDGLSVVGSIPHYLTSMPCLEATSSSSIGYSTTLSSSFDFSNRKRTPSSLPKSRQASANPRKESHPCVVAIT